jgi:hypothetical protein
MMRKTQKIGNGGRWKKGQWKWLILAAPSFFIISLITFVILHAGFAAAQAYDPDLTKLTLTKQPTSSLYSSVFLTDSLNLQRLASAKSNVVNPPAAAAPRQSAAISPVGLYGRTADDTLVYEYSDGSYRLASGELAENGMDIIDTNGAPQKVVQPSLSGDGRRLVGTDDRGREIYQNPDGSFSYVTTSGSGDFPTFEFVSVGDAETFTSSTGESYVVFENKAFPATLPNGAKIYSYDGSTHEPVYSLGEGDSVVTFNLQGQAISFPQYCELGEGHHRPHGLERAAEHNKEKHQHREIVPGVFL